MATIDIVDRRRRQFFRIDAVEQWDLDRVKDAAHGFCFAPTGGADAAMSTEVKFDCRGGATWRRPLIVGLEFLARREAKTICRGDSEPGARLRATAAVALDRALGKVDVGLEADRAAMAASGISLERHQRNLRLVAPPLRLPSVLRYAGRPFYIFATPIEPAVSRIHGHLM